MIKVQFTHNKHIILLFCFLKRDLDYLGAIIGNLFLYGLYIKQILHV